MTDEPAQGDLFTGRSGGPAPLAEPISVSRAVALAREVLEDSFACVRIQGEISRFLHHGSGHMYFQLKDSDAALSAVMFRGDNRRLRFRPQDGMDVLVTGRLSIYEPRGQFQFIAADMEPLGVGSLHLAFEQLKARLMAEGLFDDQRKRPLPLLPSRIGIATSPTGAAIRDLLRVLRRRFAEVPVLIAPCRVQGPEAAPDIVDAIRRLDRTDVDVIIVARGGGSLEDLWAFNEEVVARAIAACKTPVVSGVGHEIDVTIADLVADRRAATPSAAAEIVVASKLELAGRLRALSRRLGGTARLSASRARDRLRSLYEGRAMQQVPRRLQEAMQRVDDLRGRSSRVVERRLAAGRAGVDVLRERLSPRSLARGVGERRGRIDGLARLLRGATHVAVDAGRSEVRRLADLLQSISPLAVLARGYAICRDGRGRVVRASHEVGPGDPLHVRLHRGELDCRVTRTHAPAPEES